MLAVLNAHPANLGWSVRVIRCGTHAAPPPSLIAVQSTGDIEGHAQSAPDKSE